MTVSITVNGITYNDGAWDPVTNPYGLANGGWRQNSNLINMLLDVLADASSGMVDTSSSSHTIGAGSKVFALNSNRAIAEGSPVFIIDTDTPTNFMWGQVTDHTGANLTVNVVYFEGSGTDNDWTIQPSGPRGTAGEVRAQTPASRFFATA